MKVNEAEAPYIVMPVDKLNEIKKEAERVGFEKAVEALKLSYNPHFYTNVDKLHSSRWLESEKEEILK